jgi:predicted RNA-binding Zn ribbon-like protein
MGMALPSWVQSEEDKPAPMPLLVVQAFVNTRDVDKDTDVLSDANRAAAWLGDAGIIGAGTNLDTDDLRLAAGIRESIRALLAHNGGGPAPSAADLGPIEALVESCPARLAMDPTGQLLLGPQSTGTVAAGLLALLLVVRDAQQDGTWPRLKTCGNSECRWAFYDRSHSRRGVWCDMATCGNMIKNRNLRARRR